MKKVLALTMAAAMVLGLAACGSKPAETTAAPAAETTAAAATEAAATEAAAPALLKPATSSLRSLSTFTSHTVPAEIRTIWLVCLHRLLSRNSAFL